MLPMEEVARRIRAARTYAGLSTEELAQAISVSRMTVIRSERADRTPKPSELNAIAEACGVPRAWFSMPFEWLDHAEVVVADVRLPDEFAAEGLGAFADALGVVNVDAPPFELGASAQEVMARGGSLFWWGHESDGKLMFYFARPQPGRRQEGLSPRDGARLVVVAVRDLLEARMGALTRERVDAVVALGRGASGNDRAALEERERVAKVREADAKDAVLRWYTFAAVLDDDVSS